MKIAVYHNLPSGGAKRALNAFVRELARRGHLLYEFRLSTAEKTFASLSDYVVSEEVIGFTWRKQFPVKVPLLASFLNAFTNLYALHRLDRELKKTARAIDDEDFDLVFVHDCMISLKPAILRHLSTPTAYYCHHAARGFEYAFQFDLGVKPNEQNQLRRLYRSVNLIPWVLYWRYFSFLEAKTARAPELVMTNSDFSREMYSRDFGVESDVIPLGIDSDQFRPTSSERGGYLLTVGALTYQKGYRFLVRAVSLLPKELRLPLWIVANHTVPEERSIIENIAGEVGVEIRIQHIKSHVELIDLYSRAEVFVYAPIKEALGLAPLEAMACETPVIAVREGGPAETILHNLTGLLVDRDEEEFARALELLLGDRERRNEMGKAARRHICHNWSWEVATDFLEASFQKVTQTRCGPSR